MFVFLFFYHYHYYLLILISSLHHSHKNKKFVKKFFFFLFFTDSLGCYDTHHLDRNLVQQTAQGLVRFGDGNNDPKARQIADRFFLTNDATKGKTRRTEIFFFFEKKLSNKDNNNDQNFFLKRDMILNKKLLGQTCALALFFFWHNKAQTDRL